MDLRSLDGPTGTVPGCRPVKTREVSRSKDPASAGGSPAKSCARQAVADRWRQRAASSSGS
eukprot:6128350-Prymnesium_polylepis.1